MKGYPFECIWSQRMLMTSSIILYFMSFVVAFDGMKREKVCYSIFGLISELSSRFSPRNNFYHQRERIIFGDNCSLLPSSAFCVVFRHRSEWFSVGKYYLSCYHGHFFIIGREKERRRRKGGKFWLFF